MILGREENKLETVTENMENRTVPFSLSSWKGARLPVDNG